MDGITYFTTETSIYKVIAAREYQAAQFLSFVWRGGVDRKLTNILFSSGLEEIVYLCKLKYWKV